MGFGNDGMDGRPGLEGSGIMGGEEGKSVGLRFLALSSGELMPASERVGMSMGWL